MAAMMASPFLLLAQEAAPVSAPAPSPLPVRPLRLPGTAFASAPAATPQPQPLGTPQSAAQPATPLPAQPLRSLPAMADNEVIPTIDFPNADIRQVLEFYEKLTGKKALYDTTVSGNIQVRVLKPVTRLEAVRILETVFSLNGYTLIPGPGDIVKVINQQKNVRQFSIPIFSEPEQLPESNQVVTFLFKLDYADPTEVKTALDQVISPTPNVTSIVALAKSQAVLVTESSDVIRNLLQIVAKLDAKPAEVVSEFFTLERADAKEVVERLSKMFEKTPSTSGATQGNAPTPNRPQVPGGAIQDANTNTGTSTAITLSEDSLIVGKIKIEADTRTNRVHVVTRPVNLPFLRTLIGELDSGQPLGEPATRPLRFVLAGDVLDIVAGSVAEPGVEVKNIGGGGSSSGAAKSVGDSTSNFGTSGTSGRSSSRSSSISSGSFGSSNSNPQADNAPEARLIRNTKIIADNRINAIIVVGSDEMKSKVFKLLDEIDVRAPQVLLTAVIGELTLDNTEQFGVDYLLHTGSLTSDQISNLGLSATASGISRLAGNSLKNIASVATSTASGGGISGLVGVGNSLDLIVNALESTGRFRATSRPMIFTSNNRRAIISSGESIAVPNSTTSAYTTGTSLTSTSSIDYIDVALKLSVLPLINSDGEVTLQITQEANNTNGTTTISGNAIPNITTRLIDTTVSVANGATIVLGGLVSSQKTVSNNGIPGLMHLPLVGPLFGYKSTVTKRTELVVLIRPTVTRNPVESVRTGEKTLEKTNFKPDLDATLDPPAARIKKDAPLKCFVAPKADLRDEE